MRADIILKNRFFQYCIFFVLVFTSSCIPFKKTIILKENNDQKEKDVVNLTHDYENYKIQVDDFIDVQVLSPDKESVEIFNISDNNNQRIGGGRNSFGFQLKNAYRVEESGNIRLPLIGDVYVKELTLTGVRDTLQEIFSSYYKFVTIKVDLVSFNVTFIGEVRNPGQTRVFTENTNFFQALSNAGGQTNFANNKRVKLLRKINDKVEVHYLNISTMDFISSEFYYLKPSDIVYIEPLKAKSQRDNLFLIGVTSSIMGLAISILALLNNN